MREGFESEDKNCPRRCRAWIIRVGVIIGTLICLCLFVSGFFGPSLFSSTGYVDHLYGYYISLKESGRKNAAEIIKGIYVRRCQESNLSVLSSQFGKHPQDSLLISLVNQYVLPKLDSMSFDNAFELAPYYLGSQFQDKITGILEPKSIKAGPLEMSKLYSIWSDSDFDIVIDCLVIDVLPSMSLSEVKELLPYYKGKDFQDEIESEFTVMVKSGLQSITDSFMRDVRVATIPDSAALDSSVASVYDSIPMKCLGLVDSVAKRKIKLSDVKEEYKTLFLEVWDSTFSESQIVDNFDTAKIRCYAKLIRTRNETLKEIGCRSSLAGEMPTVGELVIAPPDSLISEVYNRTIENALAKLVLGIVDVASVLSSFGSSLPVVVTQIAAGGTVDLAINPRKYFVDHQISYIEEQIDARLIELVDSVNEENELIIENILK